MIKQLLIFTFVMLSFLGRSHEKGGAILGVWLTQKRDAKIEIYAKSKLYYGRVVWLAEPHDKNGKSVVDEKNPDPILRKRTIFGLDILIGLRSDNNGAFEGSIYDPREGTTYECKLWLSGETLKVRGYSGWLYDTRTWTRV